MGNELREQQTNGKLKSSQSMCRNWVIDKYGMCSRAIIRRNPKPSSSPALNSSADPTDQFATR